MSRSFITSAGKAGAREWSWGLRVRLVLSGRRRQATNKLKRLLVSLPHWLKTSRGAFKFTKSSYCIPQQLRSRKCEYSIWFRLILSFYFKSNITVVTVLESVGCSTWPVSMACLWYACAGGNGTKKRKTSRKGNKIKEFLKQLSDYPWKFWVLWKRVVWGSVLSLSVEVKKFNVICHITTPPSYTGNDPRVAKTTFRASWPIIQYERKCVNPWLKLSESVLFFPI